MCPHRSSFGGPLASQRDDCRFFLGIGLSAVLAGFTNNPLQMAFGLAAIGVFAAIYHPVGIAMVIEGEGNVGWRLGLNGVWGNMGVTGAPLVTGFILAEYDWRLAFHHSWYPFDPDRFGVSEFDAERKSRISRSGIEEKAEVGFAPGWKRALVSLAMVTAAGGFVS